MGVTISSLSTVYYTIFGRTPVQILLAGLDGAGKTALYYRVKSNEFFPEILPTRAFSKLFLNTVLDYKNISLDIWEVAGGYKARDLWTRHMKNILGIIFVVDSNDVDRIEGAKHELHGICEKLDPKEYVLLVFANKQDLPNCMSNAEIADKLALDTLKNCKWYIQESSVKEGSGLYEGLDWFSNELSKIEN